MSSGFMKTEEDTMGSLTLKLAGGVDVERLVEKFIPWARRLTLYLSQTTELFSYTSVVTKGIAPVPTAPTTYNGTNETTIQTKVVEHKKFLLDKENLPKRNGMFVATVLKKCDPKLVTQVEKTSKYRRYMNETPVNVVGVYQLIREKAICDPCNLAILSLTCRSYFLTIKMRSHGETIHEFISRFEDTHSFGVENLNMTAEEDSHQRLVFLAALKHVPAMSDFWKHETMRSDKATSLEILTDRAEDWATRLEIRFDKQRVVDASGVTETPQLTLMAQDTASQSKKKKVQTRFLKKTAPRDQSPFDDRMARDIMSPPNYQQSYPHTQQSDRRMGTNSYQVEGRPTFRSSPSPSGYGQHGGHRDERSNYRHTNNNPGRGFRESHNSRPRNADRPNAVSKVSNTNGTKNFFSDPRYTDQCYQVMDVGGANEQHSLPSLPVFEDRVPDLMPLGTQTDCFYDAVDSLESPCAGLNSEVLACLSPNMNEFDDLCAVLRENKRPGLSLEHLRRSTVLDSGSTFNLVNEVVPGELLRGLPFATGDTFDVQALMGGPTKVPLVTVTHMSGHECRVMKKAPMSLMSMAMLCDTHDMDTSVDNVIKFVPRLKNYPAKLTFTREGNLFILDEVMTGGTCEGGSVPFFCWQRELGLRTRGARMPSNKLGHDAGLALMSAEVSSLETDNLAKSGSTLVPGPISHDHSPIMEKSFLDAVSQGEPTPVHTKRQLSRATATKDLKLSLRGISDQQLRLMLSNGRIDGCDLTPKDVDTARDVFGNPDWKGKLTEAYQQSQLSPLEYMNPRQVCELYCDVMQLTRTSNFLIAVVLPFNFVMQVPLESTTTKALQAAFVIILGFIRAYNHEPRVVFFDLQSGINPLMGWFLQQGVLLTSTNAKTHVHRAERAIRTLKEHIRVVIQNAIIKTPKRFLTLLVQSTVRILNYEVDVGSASGNSCPAILFGLPPLVYSNLHPWMEYGEVPAPLSAVSNSVYRSRTEPALCLASHSSSNGVQVWLLKTKSFAIRDRFFPQPMTQWAFDEMQALQKNDDEDIMPDLLPVPVHSDTAIPNAVRVRGGVNENGPGFADPPVAPEDTPDPPAVPAPLPSVPARQRTHTQSYFKPWTDKKNDEFNKHDDWQQDSGKGRFRYEDFGVPESEDAPELETHKLIDGVRRSTRKVKTTEAALFVMQNSSNISENSTRKEKDEARTSELRQVIEKETLVPVMTPKYGTDEHHHVMARLLNLFMIEKEKFNSDGSHDRWKYRWVLNGNPQSTAGYDASSLSSPTPSDCIIFLFIAIAAHLGWVLGVIDVTGAFLNSFLLKGSHIYARIDKKQVPLVLQIRPDWKCFVNERGDIICKVQKGLYGLREAPLLWSRHLRDTLINEAGYVQNKKESCVFTHGCGHNMTILIVFVDDILVISKDLNEFHRLSGVLKAKYGKITTKSGDKLDYLGMEVLKVSGGFEVTQRGSIEKLLDEHNIKSTKPTPSNANFTDVFPDSEPIADDEFNAFRSVTMSLLYVARRCRPDILFQISWLTSRMTRPTVQDMSKLNHLLKYLNGTRKIGLRFVPRESESGLLAMIDASHGIHASGHGHWALCLFYFGMCVLCVSRKLKLVCRSSCESEMLGVNEGGVYVLFIRELLSSLGINIDGPTVIFQDNESAIGIMTGEHKLALSSKHINLRNLWIMDYVEKSEIKFDHRRTKFMTADLLGKGLVGHLFKRHRYGVMNWTSLKPEEDEEFMFALDASSVEMVKSLDENFN